MKQIRWFDRRFDFDFTQNIFPSIVERLEWHPGPFGRNRPPFRKISMRLRPNETWSILENIGHLTDLEPLWQGRLTDFLSWDRHPAACRPE